MLLPSQIQGNWRNEHHFKGMLNKQDILLQSHMESCQNWTSTEINLLADKNHKIDCSEALFGKDDGSFASDRCRALCKRTANREEEVKGKLYRGVL